jgi:DNA-binding response OmpR family regulator
MQDALLEEMHAARKTILIVEDDPYIGEFLTMAISQETPYNALLAETGERAFEMVQHVKPALLVLDYVLGTMNGLDFYDRIRAQQGFEAIPAIFLSASLQKYQDEINQRHLVGFVKPINLDELLLSIHQALN